MMEAFFSLLLAHFIADFPLQFKRTVEMRKAAALKRSLAGNGIHALVHMLLSFLLLLNYGPVMALLMALTAAVLHGVIDFIKSRVTVNKPARNSHPVLFLLDQGLHVISLLLIAFLFRDGLVPVVDMEQVMGAFIQSIQVLPRMSLYHKTVLTLVLLILGLWCVGVFIRMVFHYLNVRRDGGVIKKDTTLITKKEGTLDGGFMIGILERAFIILSILFDMPLVIGFILTVKSVARYKKFEDEHFVELFIIGSFISFISAILTGYLIRMLFVV